MQSKNKPLSEIVCSLSFYGQSDTVILKYGRYKSLKRTVAFLYCFREKPVGARLRDKESENHLREVLNRTR